MRDHRLIARAQLFDPAWYLDRYPDVRATGMDPLRHYVSYGAAEGRDPHPLFDCAWYLKFRPNAQEANRNPVIDYLRYGAAEGVDPHPLFDTRWYMAQAPDLRRRRGNPLVHYLNWGRHYGLSPTPLFDAAYYAHEIEKAIASGSIEGSTASEQRQFDLAHYLTVGECRGLRPCQLFDPRFYRRSNPDLDQGASALIHFRVHGGKELRRPSAEFEIEAYLRQLPAEEMEQCDNPLIHYYERGRERGLRAVVFFDALADAAAREALVHECANGRPTILMIVHAAGGGTEKHVRDLVDLAGGHANALLLLPDSETSCKLAHARDFRPMLTFGLPRQMADLIALLGDCQIARVHIHHVLGHEAYLQNVVNAVHLAYDVTLHDYHLLSPEPHLTDTRGQFVGEDLEAAEAELIGASEVGRRPRSLADWQAENRWILAGATRVLAPSHDVANRFQRHVPALQPIVAAHPGRALPAPEPRSLSDAQAPLRIGVLGTIAPNKGLNLLIACARAARVRAAPLSFHVIGSAHPDSRNEELTEAGISVTGPYDRAELPGLIDAHGLHVLWYPTQCPETFSFTLSEGFACKLPLVVSNLGALPERVGGVPWTWIVQWNLAPDELMSFFLGIRERHFLPGKSPTPSGVPWDVTDEFYQGSYLNWVGDWRASTRVPDSPPGRSPQWPSSASCEGHDG